MTTLNVKGLLGRDCETFSLDRCLVAEATRDCVPVATAKGAKHRVGLLVILDDKRHQGQKYRLEVVSYGK
ncbi:MAG: hypothetical protein PHR87_11180 [Sulfurospirillaceae bacterium]|nr:hypothetical protein [Sulfurospirillaceae bacterium]